MLCVTCASLKEHWREGCIYLAVDVTVCPSFFTSPPDALRLFPCFPHPATPTCLAIISFTSPEFPCPLSHLFPLSPISHSHIYTDPEPLSSARPSMLGPILPLVRIITVEFKYQQALSRIIDYTFSVKLKYCQRWTIWGQEVTRSLTFGVF